MAAGFRLPLPLGAGATPAATVGFLSALPWLGIGTTGAAAASIGGRLIRSHRSRTPWWDEDEALAQLLWALGISPVERDTKSLRDAAKLGLAHVLQTEPFAISYAEGALVLETAGQQLRLLGALKKHVETLVDDQDVLDLIDIIIH